MKNKTPWATRIVWYWLWVDLIIHSWGPTGVSFGFPKETKSTINTLNDRRKSLKLSRVKMTVINITIGGKGPVSSSSSSQKPSSRKSKTSKTRSDKSHETPVRFFKTLGPPQGLKLILRRLPPHLPLDVFVHSLSNGDYLSLMDPSILSSPSNTEDDAPEKKEWPQSLWRGVDWWTYVQGKLPSRVGKAPTYSRAYLHFVSPQDATEFAFKFMQHVYRDKSGKEFPVLVEKAMYPFVPTQAGKPDPLCGTLNQGESILWSS